MIAPSFIEIPLTQGQVAIIDAADLELVSQHKWHAVRIRGKWYARTKIVVNGKQKNLSLHRLLAGEAGRLVDHADGSGLNNRRSNLRPCNKSQNNQNATISRGKSQYKGVSWNSSRCRWVAQIKHHSKRLYIGSYTDERIAAASYDHVARQLHGEFAKLNGVEIETVSPYPLPSRLTRGGSMSKPSLTTL